MDREALSTILTGLIDNLPETTREEWERGYCDALADVARDSGVWYHVHLKSRPHQ
jgi:hypothetical protein